MEKKRPNFFRLSWYLAGPILVYNLVSWMAANMYCIWYGLEHPDEILVSDDLMASMEAMQKILTENYLEIGCLACAFSLLFLLRMFRKDRAKAARAGKLIRYEAVSPAFYSLLPLLGAAAAMVLNTFLIYSRIAELLSDGYSGTSELLYQQKLTLELLYMGCLVPVIEELVFRGLLQRRLGTLVTPRLALLTAALTFALYHGNLLQTIYALFMGLLFGYAYDRFHNLLAPILLHAGANLLSVILTETTWGGQIFNYEMRIPIAMAVSMVIFAGLAYLLVTYVTPRPSESDAEVSA